MNDSMKLGIDETSYKITQLGEEEKELDQSNQYTNKLLKDIQTSSPELTKDLKDFETYLFQHPYLQFISEKLQGAKPQDLWGTLTAINNQIASKNIEVSSDLMYWEK